MKKTIALLLAALMLLGLCACTAKPQEPAADVPAANDAPAAPAETSAPAPQVQEQVGATTDGSVSGRNDLNLVMSSVMGTTNPLDINSITAENVVWNIYEGLFFENDIGELEPRIAESYKVSEDGLTYTVKLRGDVLFHNGEKLTADDVVYTMTRAKDFPRMDTYTQHIASATAVDDTTVEIVADAVLARFINNVSRIRIVSKKDGEAFGDDAGIDFAHTLAGTGPYRMTKFEPDTVIEFEAFKDYYRGEASIKKVHYDVVTDAATELVKLEAGESDFISITTANVPVAEANDQLTVYMNPSTHNSYLKFNWFDEGPLTNKLVRQAVAYAINKEELMYGCYDGYGDIAENFARAGYVFGATTDGVTVYNYDPEKAKALLAEAGYPNGVDVGTFVAQSGGYFAKGVEIMAQQLEAVGIACKTEFIDKSNFANTLFRGATPWSLGFHGGAMTVDSDNFYNWMFNPVSGSTYVGNTADGVKHEINPRIVELGEEAAQTLDSDKRAELYKEMWQLVQDECYVITLFHRYNPYAANKLLNVKLYSTYYYLYDWTWQ